jgi:hypothetical protein
VLACTLLSVPVWGADGDKAIAKAHFEAATRLYDIHEYAKALDEYKAAYLAKPDPAFLFNVGQCYRKLGKLDQALEFYREYLKKAPPDDPNRPNVEARIRNTDTGDVFEGDAPSKPATQPVQPPPSPSLAPPVQRPPTLLEAQPVVVPEIENTPRKPAPEFDSSAAVGQPSQAPRLPEPIVPVVAKPPGLDLSAVGRTDQVSATPFYGTWWFWTGVGAVVVAGTVTAIIVAQSGSNGNKAATALGTQAVFQ